MTGTSLSTAQVSSATGYSVQQIRDLEAAGVIASVPRAANGYRRFSREHVRDLAAYRDLAAAVGPVGARAALRGLRSADLGDAVELVAGLHADLRREREQALSARRALRAVNVEGESEAPPTVDDDMTISELAGALGVRASTLRFWEREGLLAPDRATDGAARRYPVPQVRLARIVAELRNAGYRIPEVRRAVAALRDLGDEASSVEALEGRIAAIDRRHLALMRAGGVLAAIITDRMEDEGTVGIPDGAVRSRA
ncbi:Transcriptional regulator, MerR family OS=Tsukamurella paurometabola (strain ATCC 8368 / DSM/ CCUG 35730 / CIP 100753 / JCM 10117 / KCTC 9821 / NBRC 16120/ NCIMB 702349 / NCTC 13040) OX=521096 GN=Tpau_1320 PE=4 SV=1 [Tsukamurella paurometabola]|uniref:Transcriptional regulator, MerR family n=1 Tax=Tsukamurella paurometabola (strain ATCC 8368 / DSM 20162 / CCUG 35730 / CIP 100753 / JCM 10117 / KCTC 9821 / NBRC 16120 / NCIMB 702349 / NCTC 13040) TaxID=521096 RepID=D5UWS7_TSUPD|nr:MerR family transcriptional regulator [Tsukamurella paurometabola]ADG77949.1 transcriptional regulator, MerR family [Tsukamurella paurometabola DSM 20162]SUP29485.1 HTH-type transcriptional regulator AdhR [Tsukamurella paurometabola]